MKPLYFDEVDKDGIKKDRGYSWMWDWEKALRHYEFWEAEALENHKNCLEALDILLHKRFIFFKKKKMALLKRKEWHTWWRSVLATNVCLAAFEKATEQNESSSVSNQKD